MTKKITETQIRTTLTRKRLQEWLDNQLPNGRAGMCGDPEKCIIAQYLMETVVGNNPDVGELNVFEDYCRISYFRRGTTSYTPPLQYNFPKWVRNFIHEYDGGDFKVGAKKSPKWRTYKTVANMLRAM